MKKYWMLLVVLTGGIAPTATRGASLLDSFHLRPYGSFEFRGERAANEQDFDSALADDRQQTLTRTRLGLDATLAKEIAGRVEFVRAPRIGSALNSNAQFGKPPTDVNAELSNFFITNAYFDITGFGGIDLIRLGRQYAGRPGDLLVYYGPVNDNVMSVRSLQGVTVKENLGRVQAQLVFAKGVEQDSIPQPGIGGDGSTEADEGTNAGDVNLFYALLNSDQQFKQSIFKTELELGLYRGIDKNAARSDDANVIDIIDTRAKFFVPMPWGTDVLALSAEFALNAGQNRETLYDINGVAISTSTGVSRRYRGTASLVKASYDWRAVLQAHTLYAIASGDGDPQDNDIDGFRDFSTLGLSNGGANGGLPGSDFRYGKIYHDNANLGIGPGLDTSTIGDFGLRLFNIGVHYTPPLWGNRLTFKGDYFEARAEKTPNDGLGSRIMDEIDLELRFANSENAIVEIGWAWLKPHQRLNAIRSAALARPVTASDPIRMTYINFILKFGLAPDLVSY
ncbi:MAG: hypothetical protein IPQ26_01600 [Elusimicrobia bacterium]|nr:hypothetical protein [Elusimicrobiota bacterium]